jgi:hypothetical protein
VSWIEIATRAVVWFNYFVLVYFLLLNTLYLGLFVVSLVEIVRFLRRTFFSDDRQIMQSDMTWPISILVPAHDEEKTIAETVRSLLMVNYGEFEVIVVNDGSGDGTLARLVDVFELRRNRPALQALPSHPGGAGRLRLARASEPAGDRQGQGREVRRPERRDQPLALPAVLLHRCGFDHRGERSAPGW